jgi:hypothetical protein
MIQCPRVQDNCHLNIAGYKSNDVRHPDAEGFLGADRQHRHAELATRGEQRLIVDRIVTEGAELFEGVMDGVGTAYRLT